VRRAAGETRLLLIRHAESTWNAAGRWQGQGDPPLSPRGREQARGLAGAVAGEGIAAVVASDLVRARETAEILADLLGLELEVEPRLRELDVGRWSGLSHAEIARRFPEELAGLRAGVSDVRPGGGETWEELRARARAAVLAIDRRHPGRRVAVVTHSGLLRVLAGQRLGNAGVFTTRVAALLSG
jgi:probable phosphoglycerate mutase